MQRVFFFVLLALCLLFLITSASSDYSKNDKSEKIEKSENIEKSEDDKDELEENTDGEPNELQWSDCWEKYLPGQPEELKRRVAFECSGFSAPLYRNTPDPRLWMYKTQVKTIRIRLHPKKSIISSSSGVEMKNDEANRVISNSDIPNIQIPNIQIPNIQIPNIQIPNSSDIPSKTDIRTNVWIIPGGPGQGLQSVELANAVKYLELFSEGERPNVTVYIQQIRFFEYNLAIIEDLKILREVITLNHGYPLEWISTDIVAQDFLDVVYAVQRQEPLCEHRHYIHGISYGALVALEAIRRSPQGLFAGLLSDTGATPDFSLNELGVNMASIVENGLKICNAAGQKCPTDLKTLINGVLRPNAEIKRMFEERFCNNGDRDNGKDFLVCLQEVADYAIHMTQVDAKIGRFGEGEPEWEQTSMPFLLFALLTLLSRGGSPEVAEKILDAIDLMILQATKQDRLTRNLGKPSAARDQDSIYLRPNIMVYTKIVLSELWIDPLLEPARLTAFLESSAHPLCKLLFPVERAKQADSVLDFVFDHWRRNFAWFPVHRLRVLQQRHTPLPCRPDTKFVFISGGLDSQVPAFQIRQFAERMREAGNPLVTYLHFMHARHMPVVTLFKEEGIQRLLKDFFSSTNGVIGPESRYPLPDIAWHLLTPLFSITPDSTPNTTNKTNVIPRQPFGEDGPKLSQGMEPLEPECLPAKIKLAFGCLIATTLVTLFVFVYWLSIQFRLISLMRQNKSPVQKLPSA